MIFILQPWAAASLQLVTPGTIIHLNPSKLLEFHAEDSQVMIVYLETLLEELHFP